MSSFHNRFGRRTGRQNEDSRFEPVLSFNPQRPATRDAQGEARPGANRKPQPGSRVAREDTQKLGTALGRIERPPIERDDNFDPRVHRERALEQRASERPLYHHLFDERETRGRGFGWIAALASVAVVAIGAGYAWHNFMERPVPANLFEPPGFASRGPHPGYVTPPQPAADANIGADAGLPPSPLAATPPAATPPVPASPAATDQPPTKDIAVAPEPQSAPAEAPPPPKKTISEAAANPGDLGAAANPAPAPSPPPPVAKQPAAAPAPVVTPPPKHETAKSETRAPSPPPPVAKPAAVPAPIVTPPPKHEATKSETPRKEAAITPPRPAPAPRTAAPQDTAPPPAATERAAAPAVSAPPRRLRSPQATGQPQPLTRDAPGAYAPRPQPPQQQQPPDYAGPLPSAPDTVTVDGLTYVNGQEPHALGTLGPSQAGTNDAAMPPAMPAIPPPPPTRPYTPTDHDGGAPLPNDVIILPNGQMAVPGGR